MKLYYAPQACSLSPHIVLRELGLPFSLVRVNNQTKQTAEGQDFLTINPKGYVAALVLEDGQVLTEGPALVQYLADLQPAAKLAPAVGTWERVRLQEWLNFIATEIHAGSGPLFNQTLAQETRTYFKARLAKRLDYLAQQLGQRDYLLGDAFSVADAYLYTVLRWQAWFDIDLAQWPALHGYMARIAQRPSVIAALAAEAED